MSVIVGLVHQGEVWMGADGAVSFGETRMRARNRKVFRKGEMLIGVCGAPRVMQIIAYSFDLPPHTEGDAMAYLAGDFAEALRERLDKLDYWDVGKNDGEPGIASGSNLLIAYQGRLFYMDGRLAFYEPENGYEAAGSGAEVATGYMRGVLDWQREELDPERIVRGALYAAAEFQRGVDGPFHVEKL